MERVQDKVALVTGGASGIGLATAGLLAREGARVVIADIDRAAGERAAEAIGPRAMFRQLDVTREDDWIAVTDRVASDLGRLDILVNNAGVVLMKNIEETTLDAWRSLMAVNLDGVFLGCKHAVRVMKERGGGAIVNMSSIAGMIGHVSLAAYCASKGGVRLLTKSVALHCARRGYNIRCNSVHPSFADTPMLDAMIAVGRDPAKMRDSLTAAAPLGRLAEPGEIAGMILFLASDESACTTGAEFVIDGGMTAT
ncbi:MAG TPA: glucose 1-dehydrogenase [Xanthobacteraceae bacterium]|nr:glucose 1-dehydrogenase [Xanthobacteraceae bacterium]